MKLDVETQRLVFSLVVAITAAILYGDWLAWRFLGPEKTISAACQWMFTEWPLTFAVFLFYLGLLVGHMFPTR